MTDRPRMLSLIEWANLPVQEQIADQLSELLFNVDDLLQLLHVEGREDFAWLEPNVQRLFNDVDALIRRVSD